MVHKFDNCGNYRSFRTCWRWTTIASIQFFLTMAIAEEAEVTDAMKPKRQNVEEEAKDEFLGQKRHGFLLTMVPVVVASEANLTVLDAQQAVVRDGNAMGVAADVIEYRLGPRKRRLGIDNPLRFA